MATFKVGQRVKVVPHAEARPEYVNKEGTFGGYDVSSVLGLFMGHDCYVYFDGKPEKIYGPSFGLAPLTDPRAEEFIGDMNRFASIAKQTVRVLTPDEMAKIMGGA
jgi:hypothetical protein